MDWKGNQTMSTIETILTRAMNEPEFAEQIFTDADNALASYDLTAGELTRIKSMSHAEFMSLDTEVRKSFASAPTIRGNGFYQIRDEGA